MFLSNPSLEQSRFLKVLVILLRTLRAMVTIHEEVVLAVVVVGLAVVEVALVDLNVRFVTNLDMMPPPPQRMTLMFSLASIVEN